DSVNLAAVAVKIDADCPTTRKDDLGDVCQIVLTLIVSRLDFAKRSIQLFSLEAVDAGVDLLDEALLIIGVSVLDDLLKRVVLIANDATVTGRVFKTNTQDR